MLIDPGVPLRGQLSFTDNVQLTGGDERAYTAAGKAQRNKGFPTHRRQLPPRRHTDPACPRRHRVGRNGRFTSTSRQVSARQPAPHVAVPQARS